MERGRNKVLYDGDEYIDDDDNIDADNDDNNGDDVYDNDDDDNVSWQPEKEEWREEETRFDNLIMVMMLMSPGSQRRGER